MKKIFDLTVITGVLLMFLSGCNQGLNVSSSLAGYQDKYQESTSLKHFYQDIFMRDRPGRSEKEMPVLDIQLEEGSLWLKSEKREEKLIQARIQVSPGKCRSLPLQIEHAGGSREKISSLDICYIGNMLYLDHKKNNGPSAASLKVPLDTKIQAGMKFCGVQTSGKVWIHDACILIKQHTQGAEKLYTEPLQVRVGSKDPKIVDEKYHKEKAAREKYWQAMREKKNANEK